MSRARKDTAVRAERHLATEAAAIQDEASERLEAFALQLLLITEILRDEAQTFLKESDETDGIADAMGLPRCRYSNRNVGHVPVLAHSLDKIAAAILNDIGADTAPFPTGPDFRSPISPS